MVSEAILQRIVKLLNMSEGAKSIGNQQEAEAFAEKVQELLVKHKLSMTDLDIAKQETDDPISGEVFDPYYVKGVKVRRTRMLWQEVLAQAVASSYFCEVRVYPSSNRMVFIGRDSDRRIAMYVYHTLVAASERLVKIEYRQLKKQMRSPGEWSKGFHSSFHTGFSIGIKERLTVTRRELMRGAASTALVRIGKDLDKVKAAAKEMTSPFPNGERARQPSRLNPLSFGIGKHHGTNIEIQESKRDAIGGGS